MRRRTARAAPAELAAARQVASVLLCYPDEELAGRLPLLRGAVAALPAAIGAPLAGFLDHVAGTPLAWRQRDYVETFDLRRRSCLYLTYYAHGDTRRRGMALLQLKHLYARAGFALTDGELPDHLAVVLEFAALEHAGTGAAERAERILRENRPAVELVRLALEERASPYALVLQAVSATLPPVEAADRAAVLRLAQEGPPVEDVGLEAYGGVGGRGGTA